MPQISAVIITYNEEKYIEQCIRSLMPVVDEIVVLDSYSTDKTEEICVNLGVKFYKNYFSGYRDQKNLALQYAKFDYILSLDADEALSEELVDSILEVKSNWEYDAYSFNRIDNYCGKWLYHLDKKVRLFDRRKGEWGGLNIHEKVEINDGATIAHIKGVLLHWNYASIEDHLQKNDKYSTISAQEYFKKGKKCYYFNILLNPRWYFFKSYILKLGFLNGYLGYVECSLFAHRNYLKYLKLKEIIIEDKNAKNGIPPNECKYKIAK